MKHAPLILIAGLLLLATFLTLLFFRNLSDPDEGRYAEIPREMVAAGNGWSMTMMGYPYYEKPPMAYWIGAAALKCLGVSGPAARFPLLPAGALLAWLAWRMLIRLAPAGQRAPAFLAAAATLSLIGGMGYLATDAYLLVFFAWTCWQLYLAFSTDLPRERRRALFFATLIATAGFFTKGAIAIVLPGAIVFCWLGWERQLKKIFALDWLWAGALFLAIATPLLLLLEKHNPGFLRQFIFEEHIARYLGHRRMQGREQPWWFFIALLPLLLLPWTLFIPRAIRQLQHDRPWRSDGLFRYLATWSVIVLLFFSAGSGKLISYILPAIFPLAILLACWGVVRPLDGTATDRRLWRLGAASLPLTVVLAGVVWLVSWLQLLPKDLHPINAGMVLVLLIPILAAFFLWRKGRLLEDAGGLLTLAASVLFALALLLSPLAGGSFTTNKEAVFYKDIAKHIRPDDTLVVFWEYRPSLCFHTERLHRMFQYRDELDYGMRLAEGRLPADISSTAELLRLASNTPGRLLAVVHPVDTRKFADLQLQTRPTPILRNPSGSVLEIVPPEDLP